MTAPKYHPTAFTLQGIIDLSNELERELARLLGLNLTDYRALSMLAGSGPVNVGGLADQLGASAATTTAIVNRLEHGGYVERERAEGDRRLVRVRVTDAGSRRVMKLMVPLIAATSDHLWSLSADAQAAVGDFFEIVRGQMREHLAVMAATEPD